MDGSGARRAAGELVQLGDERAGRQGAAGRVGGSHGEEGGGGGAGERRGAQAAVEPAGADGGSGLGCDGRVGGGDLDGEDSLAGGVASGVEPGGYVDEAEQCPVLVEAAAVATAGNNGIGKEFRDSGCHSSREFVEERAARAIRPV